MAPIKRLFHEPYIFHKKIKPSYCVCVCVNFNYAIALKRCRLYAHIEFPMLKLKWASKPIFASNMLTQLNYVQKFA